MTKFFLQKIVKVFEIDIICENRKIKEIIRQKFHILIYRNAIMAARRDIR